MKNNSLIEAAIKASVSAGKILTKYYEEKVEVSNKESSRDIVSTVDHMAEETIIGILQDNDSSISIVTEERESIYKGKKDTYWLIDPLDGTVNYVNHIPFFCVSIAYVEDGAIQAGALYSPMLDDIYYGARSIGAFKNHKAIKTKSSSFAESLFSVSFSGKNYAPKQRPAEFQLFGEVNDTSRGCLRTGSAALNLAYLAEGRFNGCWGKATKNWDIGAGLLLAELAGAKVATKPLGEKGELWSYVAATPSVYDELYQKVKDVLDLES